MLSHAELEVLRRDGLGEVATIGAGHAATALSQLTDRRIMISVPQVRRIQHGDVPPILAAFGDPIAVISMRMLGDLTGQALLVFSESDASRLCDLILRRPPGPVRPLGEMEQSGLREVGNILCSAYLSALANLMSMVLLPSVPTLTMGRTSEVVDGAVAVTDEQIADLAFCVDTAFRSEEHAAPLTGAFLLMPDAPSVHAILEAIRLE